MRHRPIAHRGQTSSGFCVGSSRSEYASTPSASAAAIAEIAAAPTAARAADHSAAASPSFGDSATTQLTQHISELALDGSFPIRNGEITGAVEFLRFTPSPESVRHFHLEHFSGAI
jgi:hypothetical protein